MPTFTYASEHTRKNRSEHKSAHKEDTPHKHTHLYVRSQSEIITIYEPANMCIIHDKYRKYQRLF